MGNFLGIDMGASYVKAVYKEGANGPLQPVLNKDFNCMFRVCGVEEANGSIRTLTRDEDRQRALERGEHLLENVKPVRGDGKDGEVLEVAVLKEVLECYRDQAKNFDLSQLDRIVLTHPVSHRPASVHALKQIAVDAGLPREKLDTVEEPVALGLFAKQLRPDVSGSLFVIDAGHYTTDLVMLNFQKDRPVVRSTNYLSVRIGVAELCHRIGRSVWLKGQMAGGAVAPSESPFDEAGPEANHPLVQQLSAWAESNVIRAMGIEFFSPEFDATFSLDSLKNIGRVGTWQDKVNIISYPYDISAAQKEELSRPYPHHNANLADKIRRENYRDAIRPIIHALCAATVGVLLELPDLSIVDIALGGGMSLVPETREALAQIMSVWGLRPPVDLNYEYPGLAAMAVGRLLSIASGAAIAAAERFERLDTLSDSLGILLWYELGDALSYLDQENLLPADFDPESAEQLTKLHASTTPANVVIVPLHRVLAQRGMELPLSVEFPDDLVVLAKGATVNLTRYGDQQVIVSSIAPAENAGGVVAQIKVARLEDTEIPLRLFLEIDRNDVWRLKIKDPSGQTIVNQEVRLDLMGKK